MTQEIAKGDTVTIGKGKVRYIVTFVADEGASLMTEKPSDSFGAGSGHRHIGYVELARLRKVKD